MIRASFEEAISTRRAERLKNGKILKIILYGSYARGDWAHDPVGRYFSDFDLLVIVDHEDLTDGGFWFDATNRTMPGEGEIRTPVSIIVHSLDDVNEQLDRGRYFFADILRDGILPFDDVDRGVQSHGQSARLSRWYAEFRPDGLDPHRGASADHPDEGGKGQRRS